MMVHWRQLPEKEWKERTGWLSIVVANESLLVMVEIINR